MLSLQVLGTCEAYGLNAPLRNKRALALLVYLRLTDKKFKSREELLDLLWDPGSVTRERHSLSQVLYCLRASVPKAVIKADSARLSLDPTLVGCDVATFTESFARQDFDNCIALYNGSFMSGFPFISESFDEWRTTRATSVEAMAVQAMRGVVEQKLRDNELMGLPTLCEQALNVAPNDPWFMRIHIEALASLNDTHAALAAYASYRRLLTKEVGAPAAWMTDEFVARLTRLPQISLPPSVRSVAVPFVGRRHELATLRRTWEAARSEFRSLCIIGEPGIGKSRILTHFVRRAVLDGSRVYLHRCGRAEANVPYAAAVGAILANAQESILSSLPNRFVRAIAAVAPELGLDTAEHQYHHRVVFEAFAQYFSAEVQEFPLVLAVDDYQWADDVSRSLLAYLRHHMRGKGGLLLLSARPDAGQIDEDIETLQLSGLPVDDLDALIAQYERTTCSTVDAQLRKRVGGRTAGNPFFVLQLLTFFQTRTPNIGLQEDSVDELPSEISRVLTSRLMSLSERGRRVAAALAVLNRSSSARVLAEVCMMPHLFVAEAVDELVSHVILQNGPHFDFIHDLMRQAAYESIPLATKQALHNRAAVVLAKQGVAAGEVAAHYEIAGNLEAAWRGARQAAHDAVRLTAYKDADEHFKRMRRCASEYTKPQTEAEYVTFLYNSGRAQEGASIREQAARYAAVANDEKLSLIIELVGFEAEQALNPVSSTAVVERAKQLIDAAQTTWPELLPNVIHSVLEVARSLGRLDILEPLAGMLRDNAGGAAGAQRESVAALIDAMTHGYEVALAPADAAVLLAEKSGDPVALASALFTRGTIGLWAGNCTQARLDYEALLQIGEELGSLDRTWAATSNLFTAYLELEETELAEASAMKALALAAPAKRPFPIANLALLYLRTGDISAAERYTEMLNVPGIRSIHEWVAAQAYTLRGLVAIERGDWQRAAVALAQLKECIPKGPFPVDYASVHGFVGTMTARSDSPSVAAEYLRARARDVSQADFLSCCRLNLHAAALMPRLDEEYVRVLRSVIQAAEARGARAIAREAAALLGK